MATKTAKKAAATAYAPDMRLIFWDVVSESDATKVYEVTLPFCGCPDFHWRDKVNDPHMCKHLNEAYAAHGWVDGQTPMEMRPRGGVATSFTDAQVTYLLFLPHCTCPDFRWRERRDAAKICKHIRTAYARAGGRRNPSEIVTA